MRRYWTAMVVWTASLLKVAGAAYLLADEPPEHVHGGAPMVATAPAAPTTSQAAPVALTPPKNSPELAEADRLLLAGGDAFQEGNLVAATAAWDKSEKLYATAGWNEGRARALRNLAAAQQAQGRYSPGALQSLMEAQRLMSPDRDRSAYVALLGSLGTVYTYLLQYPVAEQTLNDALTMATADGDARVRAGILNNLGNFAAAQVGQVRARLKYSSDDEDRDKKLGDDGQDAALRYYDESAKLAAEAGDRALEVKALANAAVSAVRDGRADAARDLNGMAQAKSADLPATHEKATLLTTIGRTDRQIAVVDEKHRAELVRQAAESLTRAAQTANQLNDGSAESYAVGYLGELYEDFGRVEDAQSLARRAVFLAQKAQDNDSLYRWQWLNARLLKKQGMLSEAIDGYQRAVTTERVVQTDKAQGFGNGDTRLTFRKEVAPIFYQTADMLLQRAAAPNRAEADRQTDLLAARDTIEQLKTAELQDYFKDPCENTLPKQAIGGTSPNTAIVYIIPLADRLEILLDITEPDAALPESGKSPGSPKHQITRLQTPTPVGSAQVDQVVENFRRRLERRATNSYLAGAKQLYDWIIRPIEPTLQERKITTLVFVPDGSLRTVPMAALHDGEQFLIQKYAIAVTPSLTLTDPRPLPRKNLQLLINGISESVGNFAALPNVPAEIAAISQTFGQNQSQSLLNSQFLVSDVRKKLDDKPYSIVHIASHGEFKGDVRQTFILTWDAKEHPNDPGSVLTVQKLQSLVQPLQFEGRPVELITLSACQTAAGDDRAALGLGGFAVKSGARSAVASLWCVNDSSSVELITEFYRQLYTNPDISKAEALRRAQLKLLTDPDLSHPIYWAPYLVIGNWL